MMRDEEAKAVFDTLVDIKVGSGERVLFWKDRWIHGAAAADIAPLLVTLVPARTVNRRTVCQALDGASWTQDFEGNTSFTALIQLMHLAHAINTVPRDPDQPNSFTWPLTTSGSYSAKSNRLWTSDRRARHGLQDEPSTCYTCLQAEDNVAHILAHCTYAQEVWHRVFGLLHLNIQGPLETVEFTEWWLTARTSFFRADRRGFDTMVTAVAWALWKQRNARVFNKVMNKRLRLIFHS
ncbi:uncharacterized protein [Aegilops tauschii subsp. strangulata]|uniref:uncharacterized protein n=1 Tax=Aegilops tauschii subsp. strangulata TaxID=200361 RepID=UPI003CC869A0